MKIIAAILALCLLSGCATNTGDAAKDQRGRVTNAVLAEVFNAVVRAGVSAGGSALAGRNGQDAAHAAFIAAAQINGTEVLDRILVAYAGPQVQPVADAAMAQIAKVNPRTASDKVAVLNTIGAAIQSVANNG